MKWNVLISKTEDRDYDEQPLDVGVTEGHEDVGDIIELYHTPSCRNIFKCHYIWRLLSNEIGVDNRRDLLFFVQHMIYGKQFDDVNDFEMFFINIGVEA